MQSVPAAFAAMARYEQFILYRTQPSSIRPGKTDKFPVDWRSGAVADAHNREIWTSAENAIAAAEVWGAPYGFGFVISETDPFWFLDIDNCLTPTGWSPLALELCNRLPGAACEISWSGNGLHLFGSGAVPPHGCKNVTAGIELYTSGRFAALTFNGAQGDCGLDFSAHIAPVVALYFPLNGGNGPIDDANWTTAPCPAWGGPEDDDALIEMMLNAKESAQVAFAGKASLRDLWEANEEALARTYPDPNRAYDASSADAALAQHLAFWTGKDCARMDRLMRRSALAREKWDSRGDYYLPRTIMRATSMQGDRVLQGKGAAPTGIPAPGDLAVSPIALASDLDAHFAGCVYVESLYVAAVPDGSLLTPQQFRSSTRYGGREFPITHRGRPVKNAWEAFTENCCGFKPVHAHQLCFRPELPSRAIVEENGRRLLNNYVPIETAAKEGDVTPFLAHMAKLLPVSTDREYLVAYMASLLQNPGVKFGWAPLIQGVEGNGKSFLIEIMVRCVGQRYSHLPNAQDLANKFNTWMENKLFIGVEEIYIREKQELIETLKTYVTNAWIENQGKGANQTMMDNRANMMLLTNHKDAMPKTNRDRRYGIFFTAQQEEIDLRRDGMDGKYFTEFKAWLDTGGYEIINYFLRHLEIPAAIDPAKECRRAPVTSTTVEAIEVSLGVVEQTIQEAVASGEMGFQGGFISSTALVRLLREHRLEARCPKNRWDPMMLTLGYIKHPALPDGRLNNPAYGDEGKKSRIWVKKGSIQALNLTSPAEVARAYGIANGADKLAIGQGAVPAPPGRP
jgi:hypothetical protein